MRLLNVGAGAKNLAIMPWYEGWDVVRLDIEPLAEPDLLMDALDLDTLDAEQFDAIYASHLLEHIYPADLPRFLYGVQKVLVADGFAEFRVPNALAACEAAAKAGTIDAFCYASPGGNVTAWDMLYGYALYQIKYGAPMAHHDAYDSQRLLAALSYNGFGMTYVQTVRWELRAIACKTDISDEMKRRLGVNGTTN